MKVRGRRDEGGREKGKRRGRENERTMVWGIGKEKIEGDK